MANYLALQDRIADEVRDATSAAASDIEAQIQKAILSAITDEERAPYYFNSRVGVTFSTVAAQEYYATDTLSSGDLISALIEIDSMKITIDGTKRDVLARDFIEIDRTQTGGVTSDPTHFAYFAQQIRLYPIPDAVRTITMAYTYRLATLSDGATSNAWTTDAEVLIRNLAEADLWEKVVKVADSFARADRCMARAERARDRLLAETRRRLSNARLRTEIPALLGGGSYNILTDR